jgi:hypothetical protein
VSDRRLQPRRGPASAQIFATEPVSGSRSCIRAELGGPRYGAASLAGGELGAVTVSATLSPVAAVLRPHSLEGAPTRRRSRGEEPQACYQAPLKPVHIRPPSADRKIPLALAR